MKSPQATGFLATLILTSLFLSSLSCAEQAQPLNSNMFYLGDYDSDHDGNISLEEYLAGDPANTEKLYQHLDANQDGILDAEEQQEIQAIYQMMQQEVKEKTNSI